MRELSQHLSDLVENSVRAGAKTVTILIDEDLRADRLTIRVVDDGHGMTADVAAKAVDPFWTTRTCRRVGLGLPLLAATTTRCDGGLQIASRPGSGTEVVARFRHSHIDRPPMGDLSSTLLAGLVGHPEVTIRYEHKANGLAFELDGAAIKGVLEGVPLSHPAVIRWLERYISEGLAALELTSTPRKEESNA